MTSRPLPTDPHAMLRLDRFVRAEDAKPGSGAWLALRLRMRRPPLAAYVLAGLLCVPLCLACALVFDVPVAHLAAMAPPDLKSVAEVFSDLGLSGYMLILTALAAGAAHIVLKRGSLADRSALLKVVRERAIFIFTAVATSGLAVQVIKHVVGRARPGLASQFGAFYFDHFSFDPDLASFPSGHSTSIFALAAAIGLIAPRLRLPVFGLAVVVGLARVILTAHYASDILAGAILGVAMTLWMARLFAARSIAFTWARGMLRLKGRGTVRSALRTQLFCARTGA